MPMDMQSVLTWVAKASYFVATLLFILGIKRMSSPVTARRGIVQAGIGMVLATLATFAITGAHNVGLIVLGIAVGVVPTWLWGKKVAMTDMPQMVALFNGMGGGSAAAIGAGELIKFAHAGAAPPMSTLAFAVIGALIGSISMTGSIIAWAKLDGRMDKRFTFGGQQAFNFLVFAGALACGLALVFWQVGTPLVVAFFVLALAFGVLMTLPIGGADMPVVISLMNSYSGLAACAAGFAVNNMILIVAGALVGASGIILTQIMCKAMNRSLANVLFSGFGAVGGAAEKLEGEVKAISHEDAYYILEAASSVVIVPGYGMAVAQAQHTVKELQELLEENGAEVVYAIHPVAGRMPGHMNVLLAEADVSYDLLLEMDEINPRIEHYDVAIVIGANDVVNPAARESKGSPIYGMPIINVDKARTVFVLKRSMASGFAGIDNPLFFKENTRMLFGDAKESISHLIRQFK